MGHEFPISGQTRWEFVSRETKASHRTKMTMLTGCILCLCVAAAMAGVLVPQAGKSASTHAANQMLTGCILCLCVAAAMAGVLVPQAGKSASTHAANQLRDVAQVQHKAQNAEASNKNVGSAKQQKGDSASQSASANKATSADYAQKSANHDQAANDVAQSAQKASSAAYSQQASRKNAAAQSAVQDNEWTAQRNYKNGNLISDDIDYAHDKKYDLKDNQKGAYVYGQDSNAKASDNLYDRSSAYDRNVDKFDAAASAANQQSNDRASQAKQNYGASQAARDHFGRDAANSNQAWANQRAFSNKLDSSNEGARRAGLAQNQDLGLNKADYQRDSSLHRNGIADKQLGYGTGYGVVKGAALSPYYTGANHYGPSSNYGPSWFPQTGLNYGKGVGDYASAQNYGSNNLLQNRGSYGLQDSSANGFNKNLWANDQFQAVNDQQGAAYRDQGFSDKSNNAAQSAAAADAAAAAAQATKKQDQQASNLDEDAKFQENVKKASSDRDQNNRVFQQYYNDDNKNGNNWERFKYDREQDNDMYGFDNQQRRDKAFRDVKQDQNFAQSQNGKQADAASANEAASNRQFQDWQRAAAGQQNQRAAENNKAAGVRQGYDNQFFKYNQEQNTGDQINQNQAARDQGGSNFFGGYPTGSFLSAYPAGGKFNFGSFPGSYKH